MNAALAVLVVAVAAAGAYAWDLWRRPLTRCRRCKGTGRVKGSTSKRYGYCRACHNKKPRPRVGAKLLHPELRER